MKPALNENEPQVPDSWQAFLQGPALARAIASQLQPWWQQIFGYYLLKVGDLSSDLDLPGCKIKHQIHLGSTDNGKSHLIGLPDTLPIDSHSIDAVLLSQCLEYQTDPHHIVREAHRVLLPDGYLLLTGFNPLSILGLAGIAPWLKQRYPWQGRFFSPGRIKDWLHLIGFEVLSEQRFFYGSMLVGDYADNSMQRFAEKYLNYFAGCYLLVARKRELPLTPIRPRWQLAPAFTDGVKGVSARQGCR